MDTVERAQENGGGSGRTYNRVTSGEHGGEFSSTNQAGASSTRGVYAPRPKKGGAAKEQPKAPSSSKFRTLAPGEDNDGQAVAEMQQLLTALGLGNLTSGQYDADTENAVKEAQRRLGIKPNGKASKALINKMLNAYDLSPCIKRSEDPDEDDLTRSDPLCEFTVSRSEDLMFDALRAAVAEPDENDLTRTEDDEREQQAIRAYMSTQDINNLPDDAFAYIEDGGHKDASGRTVPRSLRHFPIHDEAHVRNALARMSTSPFGDKAMAKIHKAAKRMGIGDYDMDHDMDSGPDKGMDRSAFAGDPEILRYDRMWDLDDIEIVRGGSGREVTAYAAVFDTPAEIKDQHGHYMEVISRSAFNRAISHGIGKVGFYYHHGMTLAGTPSDLGSVPIGSPIEVRADGKGLRTVSRFNKSALADATLEAIRAGDIKGYSFRGRIFQSTPDLKRVPRSRSGELPTITRTELGLTEYGPTPTPYYAGAGIVAIRSAQQVAEALAHLDPEARDELLRIVRTSGQTASTPQDPDADDYATPSQGPGAEDPPQALRSASAADIRRRIRLEDAVRSNR